MKALYNFKDVFSRKCLVYLHLILFSCNTHKNNEYDKVINPINKSSILKLNDSLKMSQISMTIVKIDSIISNMNCSILYKKYDSNKVLRIIENQNPCQADARVASGNKIFMNEKGDTLLAFTTNVFNEPLEKILSKN